MNCVILATDPLILEETRQIGTIARELKKRGNECVIYSRIPNAANSESYKKIFFNPTFRSSWGICWLIMFPILFCINTIRLIQIQSHYTAHILLCATLSDVLLFAPCARLLGISTYVIFPKPIPPLLRWIYHICISKNHVILPFSSLQNELALYHADISIIPPCIFIRQQPLPLDQEHARVPQRFILGTASSLTPYSGVEYIIKAIPLIQEMLPHIQLVIVGDGPEKQRILWLVAQLGLRENIKLVGSEENRESWMKHFTLFAFCPAHSFVPMQPVLEAMAARKVVIASDIPPLRDIITPSKHGILVPPRNSEMIAQAVINLFNHPDWRETMGGLAAKHVQEYFSTEKVISKYEALFESSF